jgi:23S rRNA (pseudouridine1915-N3)-methyltransferase
VRLSLIAVGSRLPVWVQTGFAEYAKRLPRECRLELIEIPVEHRARNADIARLRKAEGERILAAVPPRALLVALDERGKSWTSVDLSRRLEDWMREGPDVALMVGGPDGLDSACLDRALLRWSLSALTLPHGLVRVMVAEQIYRAWSILRGHPYHRA